MKTWKALLMTATLLSSAAHAIEVHGHRGARARRPENTIPAFEHALAVGADVLEFDLGVTRDDRLVVAHDPEMNGVLCLDPEGKRFNHGPLLRSLTLDEVKKYDCGTIRNPRFPAQEPVPGTRMPTLDEVFTWLKNHPDPRAQKIGFNIETKQPDKNVGSKRFAELAVAKIKEYNMLERSVLQSFDHEVLREARKIEPKLRLSALTNLWNQNSIAIADEFKVEIISPSIQFVSASMVKKLHAKGVKVIPWTANDRREWARLVRMDVDGIITDDPEALIAYLKEKGLR